jgi:hypothetical protein
LTRRFRHRLRELRLTDWRTRFLADSVFGTVVPVACEVEAALCAARSWT